MAKFYGSIGYAETSETSPGVWTDGITERNYYGDVNKISRRYETSENLNDNLTIQNEFSIVADPFAYQNFHLMKYVRWMDTNWKITRIEVREPRLILTVGGVYNGTTGPTPDSP